MYYFLVVAFKHLSVERRLSITQCVIDRAKRYQVAHIVEENGRNGDSPHINVVISTDKETTAKSFRQCIARIFEQGEITNSTLCGKVIHNDQNLANVIAGYLQKENAAKTLFSQGIDLGKLEKMREKKVIEQRETFKPVSTVDLHDLLVNFYKQHYAQQPFDKRLFSQMVREIAKTRNLMACFRNMKSIYLALDGQLGTGQHITEYLDRELDFF